MSSPYGAPLGRRNVSGFTDKRGDWHDLRVLDNARPFRLVQVPIDAGGYDPGGAYWGHGGSVRLYGFALDECIKGFVWAPDREAAKAEVRHIHPLARFYK